MEVDGAGFSNIATKLLFTKCFGPEAGYSKKYIYTLKKNGSRQYQKRVFGL